MSDGVRRCVRGHLIAGDNAYTDPRGYDGCRECRRAAQRKHNLKRRREHRNVWDDNAVKALTDRFEGITRPDPYAPGSGIRHSRRRANREEYEAAVENLRRLGILK